MKTLAHQLLEWIKPGATQIASMSSTWDLDAVEENSPAWVKSWTARQTKWELLRDEVDRLTTLEAKVQELLGAWDSVTKVDYGTMADLVEGLRSALPEDD